MKGWILNGGPGNCSPGGVWGGAPRSSGRICAGTVAYRNPSELSVLLTSLGGQTRPVDALLVVDNSADSGVIEENRRVFGDFAQANAAVVCEFAALPENTGSAGGFRRVMEWTHRGGYDWVWLLDQDGVLDPGCLEALMRHETKARILCPRVFAVEDQCTELYFAGRINLWGRILPLNSQKKTGGERISLFCTHGTLIARQVMTDVGYYDDENFFFRLEDLDYAYRAAERGTPVLQVREARVYHPAQAIAALDGVLSGGWSVKLRAALRNLFPLFLLWSWMDDTDAERLRHRSYRTFIRRNVRGPRLWGAFCFSSLCLVALKCAGRDIPLAAALREYGTLLGGRSDGA